MKDLNTPSKFPLNNTLRHLINACWYRETHFIAIEFEHRGKKYRADTAKDAAELLALLEVQDSHGRRHETQSKFWATDQATDLINNLGPLQQKLLSVLACQSSVGSETLVAALDLDSEIALAGVVSGLSKQARSINVNPHDLYSVSVQWDGKYKTRYFRINEDFSRVLHEIGWPAVLAKSNTELK